MPVPDQLNSIQLKNVPHYDTQTHIQLHQESETHDEFICPNLNE